MRIRIGHSSAFDFQSQLYTELRAIALPRGVTLSLPHEGGSEGDCTRSFFEEGCSLFIVEASYPSTGLGMEVAYAAMLGVPIVCVHRQDFRPSSSLLRVTSRFLAYADEAELRQHVTALLSELTR